MAYVDEICDPLIRVLEHNAGLQLHQLAGHTANIDFWISEVVHGLAVIDGYRERFEKLKWTQAEYERDHPRVVVDKADWGCEKVVYDPLLRPTTSNSELQRLRRRLVKAAKTLIDRSEREGLIELSKADDLRKQLGE